MEAAARTAADAVGIPEAVFFGLVQTESGWNPDSVSAAGAIGLTQIMPWWAPKLGRTLQELKDPVKNLTDGAKILADEINRFGSIELALMAYNAGAPTVQKAIAAAGTKDPSAVSAKLPAAETRAYWQKVMNWARHFSGGINEVVAEAENAITETSEAVQENPGLTAGLILIVLFAAWAGSR